jgi:hypothetical protein
MRIIIPRKKFLTLSLLSSAALFFNQHLPAQDRPQKPPPLDKELVKEFVGKSHSDLNRVKELFSQQPGLLNCSWDWGGGDFETGLEAAGHVGNKEIAQFLLDNGARMNIFCAAMLGKIEIVKSILTAFPELKTSKGPHGLQLLHHAKKGGDDAKEVLQYLQSISAQ